MQARQFIFQRINDSLKKDFQDSLDALLSVEDDSVSTLQWLKKPPRIPSAAAMKELMEKLVCIEKSKIIDIDLSWLNNTTKDL